MSDQDEVDVRWNTKNTKLASALLVLGFELAKQPFTSVANVENAASGYDTTIWFRPWRKGRALGSGEPNPVLLCQGISRIWDERKENRRCPQVYWMRKGLEGRDWILKDYTRREFRSVEISNLWIVSDNRKLAYTMAGIGRPPLAFRDHKFYFHPNAVLAIQEFNRQEGDSEIQWSKAAVEQQEILVNAIKGPRNNKQISVKNNQLDRSLLMAVNAPSEIKRMLLRALDEN